MAPYTAADHAERTAADNDIVGMVACQRVNARSEEFNVFNDDVALQPADAPTAPVCKLNVCVYFRRIANGIEKQLLFGRDFLRMIGFAETAVPEVALCA